MTDATGATARFTPGRLVAVVVLGLIAAGSLVGRFLVQHQIHDQLTVVASDPQSEDALERRAVVSELAPAGTALTWIGVVAALLLLVVIVRTVKRPSVD